METQPWPAAAFEFCTTRLTRPKWKARYSCQLSLHCSGTATWNLIKHKFQNKATYVPVLFSSAWAQRREWWTKTVATNTPMLWSQSFPALRGDLQYLWPYCLKLEATSLTLIRHARATDLPSRHAHLFIYLFIKKLWQYFRVFFFNDGKRTLFKKTDQKPSKLHLFLAWRRTSTIAVTRGNWGTPSSTATFIKMKTWRRLLIALRKISWFSGEQRFFFS